MSAPRILIFGGILLIILGMLLGELYAIFISHVTSAEIQQRWAVIVEAVRAGNAATANQNFSRIEGLLERRGRIVNTHSHVVAFGFLALGLALLQPAVLFSEQRKRQLAWTIIAGGTIQPLGVFVSSYTGWWAIWLSDTGSILVLVGVIGTLVGLSRSKAQPRELNQQLLNLLRSKSSQLLVKYGGLLILLGMIFGFYYAWVFVTQHEPRQVELLRTSLAGSLADARPAIFDYRTVQSKIAIISAAHSHAIEMGTLAILLAFAQSLVSLGERWKLRWTRLFLLGSFLMPIFVYNATIFGLVSAGFADLSGLLIVVALAAMLVGLLRYSGVLDAQQSKESA